MLVPTPRLWVLFALGLPIAAIAYQRETPGLLFAYDVLIVAIAVTTAFLAPRAKVLNVKRRFDHVLSVRAANRIDLWIENTSDTAIDFVLRDEPPPTFPKTDNEFDIQIGARGVKEVHYEVTPRERGSDSFRGTFVRIACPLGLVVRQERLPTDEPLHVYPNVLALRQFDLLNQKGRLRELGIRRTRMRGLGMEFESLREHAEGDDFRKIDWKASARMDKLIVRQYETERNQCVIIVIDVGRHMLSEVEGVTKLDLVLDASLMLSQAAVAAGDNVGLLVYADRVLRFIPPQKSRTQVGMIIEAIHDLVALPVESDPAAAFAYLASRWKRRSLIVSFTDSGDADRARELSKALHSLVRRHLVLAARISDPKLREIIEARTDSVEQLYRKAAGLLIDEDRRQATSVLEVQGIRSLESEPQDLVANLVSFYFYVKEHALI